MGNTQGIPVHHIRIYENLLSIQSQATRIQTIKTVMSSPEHVASARIAGIYGNLLHYIQVLQAGGAPPPLPGEKRTAETGLVVRSGVKGDQLQKKQVNEKGNERAVNYFSACLRILDLEEEVALTEDTLKTAYKKAVIRAHPDKGGTEKEFEAVTRAYAYLGEILKRIHGGRAAEGKVEAPTALAGNRSGEADKWRMVEPVALNPDKLDLKSFNTMFEKTRIPDPEESGYGDWLKGDEGGANAAPQFSGKFNRDVFNKAFEGEGRGTSKKNYGVMTVQEQSLASRLGYATELGRTGREDYTVAPHDSKGLVFTDLKKAYTEYNTFSQETSDVKVTNKSLDQYQQEREKAPAPLLDHEMAAVLASEKAIKTTEDKRKLRLAQEATEENSYFERMKRLVIRNQ
jgi:curved DNA-binding protein CbpA